MDPNKYQVVEKLRDGSTITIRAIRPDDRDRFMHGFKQFITSPDSVRFRFRGFRRSLSDPEATDMTEVDFVDHVALVSTFGTQPEQPLIGVGDTSYASVARSIGPSLLLPCSTHTRARASAHCCCNISR
jgi:hypothetical protein